MLWRYVGRSPFPVNAEVPVARCSEEVKKRAEPSFALSLPFHMFSSFQCQPCTYTHIYMLSLSAHF